MGTGGCSSKEYPLFKDDVKVSCHALPLQAATAAKELGATEIDTFDVADVPSGVRVTIKLQENGTWKEFR